MQSAYPPYGAWSRAKRGRFAPVPAGFRPTFGSARYAMRNRARLRAGSRHIAGSSRAVATVKYMEMPLHAPVGSFRPEMKYADVAEATYTANTTGSVQWINAIAPGSSMNQREGSRVKLTSVRVRGRVTAGSAGVIATGTLVLVYDSKANGASPAITDVYETVNSTSLQNTTNRDRFKILARYDYTLVGNSTTPVTGREQYVIDQLVNIPNLSMVWGEVGTAAISNTRVGTIHALTFGDTAAGTGAPNFTVQYRTSYGDN